MRRGVTGIQQTEHSSQYQINIYTFNISNVIGLGGTNLVLAQYLKLRPFNETCNMECTPNGNFLSVFDFTSFMSLLPFF